MVRWLWVVACIVTPALGNSTVYSLIRNGDFEKYKDWIILPNSAWCDQWCGGPSQWTRTAGYYIHVAPKIKSTITQHFNYTTLGIESFDTCDLIMHVRAMNTIDIVLNVIWAKEAIPINWATYLATAQNSPTDWVEMHVVLSQMSDSLQFQMSTGYNSWLELDNVSLYCSENSTFFSFSSWEVVFIVLTALIAYGVVHQLYIRAGYRCACCNLCVRRPKFIPLQDEEPAERTIELTAVNTQKKKKKSVLEDSDSGEVEPKKERSPFIDEE